MLRGVALSTAMAWGAFTSMMGATAACGEVSHAYYSSRTDQLVVTLSFKGTSRDHIFSIRWANCLNLADGSGSTVMADIVDHTPAERPDARFITLRRFDLASVSRQGRVTLFMAPSSHYILRIPARSLFSP